MTSSNPQEVTAAFSHVHLDTEAPHTRHEILTLVMHWLDRNGYSTSLWTLREEGGLQDREAEHRRKHIRSMTEGILSGNWDSVTSLTVKSTFRGNKAFQYALARQQYLEIVSSRDSQKALAFIVRRLKPLEQYAPEAEFHALCYLLTCRSVHESSHFRSWDETNGRQRIIDEFPSVLSVPDPTPRVTECDPARLETLLRQACAYQVLSQSRLPDRMVHINSILHDYTRRVIPNAVTQQWTLGPSARCMTFCGPHDNYVASTDGEGKLYAWQTAVLTTDTTMPEPYATVSVDDLYSKIWDLNSPRGDSGEAVVAAASADGAIWIWNVNDGTVSRIPSHTRDAYTCCFTSPRLVATGGYDKMTNLVDIETGTVVRSFPGHTASVTSVAVNNTGTVVASASKDGRVCFFDLGSGVCINTLCDSVSDVAISSIGFSPDGETLATSTMNSTVRLWDLAASRKLPTRLKGHVNTRKNFIGMCFGSSSDVVYSGSEDGVVHAWTTDGRVMGKLSHDGTSVHTLRWSQKHSVLATCAHDGVLRLWSYDDALP
eukprot:PhM_4_TR17293/c0_g1_i1/m.4511